MDAESLIYYFVFAATAPAGRPLSDADVRWAAERACGLRIVLLPGQSLRVERRAHPSAHFIEYRLYRVTATADEPHIVTPAPAGRRP